MTNRSYNFTLISRDEVYTYKIFLHFRCLAFYYPNTHSFFVIFFVLPWFCIFAKARNLWDALTFAKKQNAIPQNKKTAKKPIFPVKNHKIKERPYMKSALQEYFTGQAQ